MSFQKSLWVGFTVFMFSLSCMASTYIVKKDGTGDYTIIQDAVNATISGDTVIVYPGTYYESISISGKAIILTGSDSEDLSIVEQTIVDANNLYYGISLVTTNESMLVSGLCIQGARRAGLYLGSSGATIQQCILRDNANGVWLNYSYGSVIKNNIIYENTRTGVSSDDNKHAGVRVTHGWGMVLNNMIYDNKRGITFDSACTASSEVYNNTIVNHDDYGIYSESPYAPVVTNCILWDCNDDLYGCSSTYSCIQDGDGGDGNIQENPIFFSQFSEEDLVSWWELNEESGTTAYDSAGDNDGTIYGSPARGDGLHSGAIIFDGVNDYINCGSDSTLDLTDEITISTWIKLDEKKHSFVVAKRNGSDTQYALYLYFPATSPYIYFFINEDSNALIAANTLVTGQWYHLAVTFNSMAGQGQIYLNGEAIAFDTTASAITSDPNCPLYIGSCGNGSGGSDWRRFKGSVDDVKIYNRALSSGEIHQLYQYGLTEEADYHLGFHSPCLNAGDPNTDASDETDIDNEKRIVDVVEMGCDELDLFSTPSMHFGIYMNDSWYSRLFDSLEKFQYLLPRYTWEVGSEDANDLASMVSHIHTLHPDASLGYHFHPTNATWGDLDDPICPAWLHIEDFNDIHPEWILRDADGKQVSYQGNFNSPYLDITEPNARAEIVSEFIQRTTDRDLDALNYDNLCYQLSPDPTVVSEEDWLAAIFALLNETRDGAESYGLKVFGNIGCSADLIADAFASYVDHTDADGLSMEMVFHENVRTDADLEEEMNGYEYALEHGRTVVLFMVNGQDKPFALGKIRPLAEKYDNIYLVKHGMVLNPSTYGINDEMACLDIYSETLVQNSCFDVWNSNNDPQGWLVAGENGTTREVMEMGYFVSYYYNNADPNNYNMMQNQTNFGDPNYKPSGGTMNPSYGTGACNLYTTSSDISLSQDISTIPGNTYRYSMFIGQAKLNDNTLFGKLIVSIFSGGDLLEQETYTTYGVKTFTFTADSASVTVKLSNDPNETGTTDVTFDDVAIWSLDKTLYVYNSTQEKGYNKIQSAIDEAEDGDEIVVYPGTYYEQVDFGDWSGTLRSVDPNDWDIVAATIIDLGAENPQEWSDCTIFIDQGQDQDTVLKGLTVTGGYCGVYIENASPIIERCIIEGNEGIGLTSFSSSPTIRSNIIRNQPNWPGGIYCGYSGMLEIYNNWFYNNSYAILFRMNTFGEIFNNTLVENSYGISHWDYPANLTIKNCILYDNWDDLSGCAATYSCISDGDSGTGNITTDPNFANAGNYDFHLLSVSPCIDTGDPNGVYTGWVDIDGEDRVMDGDGDETETVDMGADEYNPD